mmetsp:Transcript_46370/g.113073  ORF Transcript_46370/g.113073 Transcript_46370/m.113073 type:complete len:271 (+) Transcript_46370:288-1100(+)
MSRRGRVRGTSRSGIVIRRSLLVVIAAAAVVVAVLAVIDVQHTIRPNNAVHVVVVEAFSTSPRPPPPPPSRVFLSTPTKRQKTVEDCMTRNPMTLKTTDTVDEAIELLLRTGFNGAPVVDPVTNNLVGVVSAFDFFQMAETGAVLPIIAGDEQEQAEMAQVARKIVATTVGDLMAPAALTISPELSIRDAADLMLKDRCHRLCVVDESNSLVGVLATSDIMKNVISALRALPAVPDERLITIDADSESVPEDDGDGDSDDDDINNTGLKP